MRVNSFHILGTILLVAAVAGCHKKDNLNFEPLSSYYPLQPGKYITYRLDSTVFYPFLGRGQEVHSYQEKHVVDSALTDNSGRTGYRVFRYLRDTAGLNAWTAAGTYFVLPLGSQVEVVENNQRVINLIQPIKQGQSWKGNTYLPSAPFSETYEFNDDNHLNLNAWNFSYGSTKDTVQLNGTVLSDVLTVKGPDEATNVPITDKNAFASRTYRIDKYAKGIGLVYQELALWEYQPNPNPNSTAFSVGFALKRSMIDHN